MPVAYVSDVEGKNESAASPLTLASVNGGGGNFLYVAVAWRADSGQTISSATYSGGAMTAIGAVDESGFGCSVQQYYVANPAGTASVVITFSAACINSGVAIVFSGVDTGSPVGTTVSETDTGTATSTAAVTSAADGMVVDVLMIDGGAELTLTPDGTQTQRSAQETELSVWHRTSTKPGASSVTMAWSIDPSRTYVHVVTPINAAAAGDTNARLIGGDLLQSNLFGRLVA